LPAVSAAGDPALRALLADGCVGWWTHCCALHAAALMRLDVREDVARHLSAKDRLQRHSAALAWMALAREPMSSAEQSVRRRAAAVIAEGPSLGVVEMVELLRASDLFAGTREAILADVVAVLTEQTLSPGDVLCREGEPGGELYVVAGGAAQVMRQGHFLAEVGRGAIIGEFAVILGAPCTATVTATTTLHLYCLNESSLSELLVSERAIARRLVQLMISRASANRVTLQHG
jgi:Cyclic nucleotide-binding domain